MTSWWGSRCGSVARSSEGKFWNVTDEEDGIMVIAVRSMKLHQTNSRKMRRCDYDNKECYPVHVPVYSMDKEFA